MSLSKKNQYVIAAAFIISLFFLSGILQQNNTKTANLLQLPNVLLNGISQKVIQVTGSESDVPQNLRHEIEQDYELRELQ